MLVPKILTSTARVVGWVSGLCISIALIAYAALGNFTRYLNDDYCVAAAVRDHGLVGSQYHWYATWSGRFSYNFLATIAAIPGPQSVRVIPAILIICWCGSLFWTLSQMRERVGSTASVNVVISLVVVYATIQSSPDLLHSVYWQAGALTYCLPLILLTLYAGFIISIKRRRLPVSLSALVSFLFAFFTAGLSETALAFLAAALFLGTVAILFGHMDAAAKKTHLAVLAAGFAGVALVLVIGVMSPGNAIRQAAYPLVAISEVISTSFAETCRFFLVNLRSRAPLSLAVSFLTPFLLALNCVRAQSRFQMTANGSVILTLGLFLTAFALVFTSLVPSIYAVPGPPMSRVLMLPQFIVAICVAALGYLAGSALRKLEMPGPLVRVVLTTVLLIAMVVLGPIAATRRVVEIGRMLKVEAEKWDAADSFLVHERQSGKAEALIVPIPWHAQQPYPFDSFDRATSDAGYTLDTCVEKYYDLKIRLAPPR